MYNIRRILVPVDFSQCSLSALEHAAALAKKFGAEIDLLHVWQMPSFTPHGGVVDPAAAAPQLFEIVRAQAEKEMARFASEARARGIEIRSTTCELGPPALTIVETARDYDLIVIGTRGRTRFAHLLLGSVAERVVQLAKCPVMTIRSASDAAR